MVVGNYLFVVADKVVEDQSAAELLRLSPLQCCCDCESSCAFEDGLSSGISCGRLDTHTASLLYG